MNTIGKKIEPEAETEDSGTVLGSLSGQRETDAGAGAISTPAAPQKSAPKPRKKAVPAGSPAPVDVPLALPKGALVSMRKSGGVRFSSRTVTVHRDGRVGHGSSDNTRSRNKGLPSRLTSTQLSKLKREVSKAGLETHAARKGIGEQQSPDSYAYEIVARVGNKVQSVEMLDGNIPDSVMPLIRELNALMPK